MLIFNKSTQNTNVFARQNKKVFCKYFQSCGLHYVHLSEPVPNMQQATMVPAQD